MLKAKSVVPENIEERTRIQNLKEVSGKIVFSETKETGCGSCLILKFERDDREFWWQSQSKIPATIEAEDIIRVFYKDRNGVGGIILTAYEKLSGGKVLTRATERGYIFID